MKIVAIIQARMGSTRLPGKILKKVLEKPLLEYQIERVKRAKLVDEIVIATTTNNSEQPIIDFCEKHSILYYRGSEEDVLSRYYEAAKEYKADTIIRLTSDCPIIDPVVIDKIIEYYTDNQPLYNYVSNTINRTYPRGYDTEVISYKALENVYQRATSKSEKEHVTSYVFQNPHLFHIEQILNGTDHSNFRLTVDTYEDFVLISKIITSLYPSKPTFDHRDIMQLLHEKKEWLQINAAINQKKF